MSRRKDIFTAIFGAIVALILWITIFSREKSLGTPITYRLFHSLPSFFNEIQKGRIGNSLGNMLLFIPVGLLVPEIADCRKLWKTAGLGSVFSFFIETIQLLTSRGCFDPDDLILNTMGTAIGYGLYCLACRLFISNN